MTIQEKIDYYSLLHKQNLNGRETEDELFEAGISVGIQEADDYAIGFAYYLLDKNDKPNGEFTIKELLEIYKKKSALH